MKEKQVKSWVRKEDPQEKGMVTHSSIFTWEIHGPRGPGGRQSMGLETVRQDSVTKVEIRAASYLDKDLKN